MRASLYILIMLACIGHSGQLQGQKTALLLIDIQEFYFPGGHMQLDNPEQAGMNAGLVLAQFREKAYPVYHVRHEFEQGGNIHQYVRPLEDEKVFSKKQVNAFLDTELLLTLRRDSIDALVICGMQTHMCVEAAVRAAHDYGFSCLLVQDACATRALQYEEHIISAQNVHYSSIQTLQSYARVIMTAKLLEDFDHSLIH